MPERDESSLLCHNEQETEPQSGKYKISLSADQEFFRANSQYEVKPEPTLI